MRTIQSAEASYHPLNRTDRSAAGSRFDLQIMIADKHTQLTAALQKHVIGSPNPGFTACILVRATIAHSDGQIRMKSCNAPHGCPNRLLFPLLILQIPNHYYSHTIALFSSLF